MMLQIVKIAISVGMITGASWLAGKKPGLAGFLVALPLTSLLTLSLNYLEYRDPQRLWEFGRSIAVAVPISLLFFVPFFLVPKERASFLLAMGLGLGALALGYLLHRSIFGEN
jgi:hypothetical protein